MGSADTMTNVKTIIFGLHGFLGQGSDFESLKNVLPENIELIAPDLFFDNRYDLSSFEKCADQFANHLTAGYEKKILIGYSLGGRIGLHILDQYPDLFDQYIFLSTNPGLTDEQEKKQRLIADGLWAEKILTLKWSDFLQEWNSQSVFSGGSEPVRFESQFNKNQLICAVTSMSLAKQKNMNAVIEKHQQKIKWVVGDKDQKYLDLAEDLKQKKILENYSRISSVHRILFDADMSELIKIILQQQ
jgi:2-succinyl-6-hydroxy-2,4-cyclohexadiene-1-carboxylate synthase